MQLTRLNIIIKNIIKLLFVISFLILIFKIDINAQSAENCNIYFIFNKTTYTKGETVKLSINIDEYKEISEIKLNFNKLQGLEPIKQVSGYFQLTNFSIIEKVLINEYTENNSLKLHLYQELNNPVILYKNNICEISFQAVENINNIYSCFEENYKIYLFNKQNELLEYQVHYNEKIDVLWNVDNYSIEVYDEMPNYLNDIIVNNRESNEFEYIIYENLDNTTLGIQIISVIVLDKFNYDAIFLSKAVEVKDTTAPMVSYEKHIELLDPEISTFDLQNYLQINDNYDLNPIIKVQYFDENQKLLDGLASFKTYLATNHQGEIHFIVYDQNNNQTDEKVITINIKDITAPVVSKNFEKQIEIKDTLLNEFRIEDYFTIVDQYDPAPLFIYNLYDVNNNEVTNINQALIEKQKIFCHYFGKDKSGNDSVLEIVEIVIIDTTAPVLLGVNDLILKDVEVVGYSFDQEIITIDNIDLKPTLISHYYLVVSEVEVQMVEENEFINNILKGKRGYIEYSAMDSSLNYSQTIRQNIMITDTTAPVIKLLDIKDKGKYLKLETINYEIIDNFEGTITKYITLNDFPYQGTLINEVGEYQLEIIAQDESGNEAKLKITFTIIENNILGCGNDLSCFIDNYSTIVIVVSVLIISIVIIFIIKILYSIKKKKNRNNFDSKKKI